MKILLIQSFSRNFRPIFPVGLARIASAVENRHEISVFDPNIEPSIEAGLGRRLEEFRPDVIGISLRTIDSVDYVGREYFYPDFVRLVKFLRRERPEGRIVVGGGGFSLFAREIMRGIPEIDFGVVLEGEETFPELLENLDRAGSVRGLLVREEGEVRYTGEREPVNFQDLPPSAYRYFEVNRYISPGIGIGIESKRGCRLTCSYCPYPYLTGSKVRMRSPKAIVDEIESLVARYGIRQFAFIDPVFNIPLDHAEQVCREILARKLDIRWSSWTNEKMFTESYARTAIAAGCVAFPFSTDGFSDESLEALGKNYTNADILKTVEVARKIDGIHIGYAFFLNPPGSTVKSFFGMCRFLLAAKRALGGKMKLRRHFLFNRIRIEPHTRLHERAMREGLITPRTNLLEPVYYSQPATRAIEASYDALTFPLAVLIRIRRILKHGVKRRFRSGAPRAGQAASRAARPPGA